MKSLVLLALLSISLCHLHHETFVSQQYVEAQKNEFFETYSYEEHPFKGWSVKDMKKLLGLKLFSFGIAETKVFDFAADLPESFNSVNQWPECIHPIRDQGHCGSCWAHAASEVLSDRYCIASKGAINVVLSPEDMVTCDYLDHGCNGGILTTSWMYLKYFGIVSDTCKPYTSGDGKVPSCPLFKKECKDGSEYKKYKAKNFYYLKSINDIKTSIMNYGPVETGFMVYEDFMSYKSGVYKRTSNKLLGGHAVKIVGWGKENGTEYWVVANSWSPKWGEQGYFRIAMGECNFESGVIAGDPAL